MKVFKEYLKQQESHLEFLKSDDCKIYEPVKEEMIRATEMCIKDG